MFYKDYTGQIIDNAKIIKRIGTKYHPSGRRYTAYLVECLCENHTIFEVNSKYLSPSRKTFLSCGCCNKTGKGNCIQNKYDLTGEYGVGYTKQGEEFYFDLEDYDIIKQYYWWINCNGYVGTGAKNCPFRFMHNLLMGTKGVDHKNRKRNDNRKNNLRLANPTENGQNKGLQSNNHQIPKVSGVYYRVERNSWYAQITIDKKTKTLIYTHSMEEAIKARLQAEKEYFGDFAPQKHLFEKYGIK